MSNLVGKIGSGDGLLGAVSPSRDLKGAFGGSSGGIQYEIGPGLKVEGGVLSVDTADKVEQDNTKLVTSAAVHVEVGNIEVLLAAL